MAAALLCSSMYICLWSQRSLVQLWEEAQILQKQICGPIYCGDPCVNKGATESSFYIKYVRKKITKLMKLEALGRDFYIKQTC